MSSGSPSRKEDGDAASCGEGGALLRGTEMQIIHDFYKTFRKAFRVPGMDTEMLSAVTRPVEIKDPRA